MSLCKYESSLFVHFIAYMSTLRRSIPLPYVQYLFMKIQAAADDLSSSYRLEIRVKK